MNQNGRGKKGAASTAATCMLALMDDTPTRTTTSKTTSDRHEDRPFAKKRGKGDRPTKEFNMGSNPRIYVRKKPHLVRTATYNPKRSLYLATIIYSNDLTNVDLRRPARLRFGESSKTIYVMFLYTYTHLITQLSRCQCIDILTEIL